MGDMFPFPNLRGKTPTEKIDELVNYLIQFKETLEFALDNISTENLSPELVNKLNDLGANIEQTVSERESELAQITVKEVNLSISDVCNSTIFKESVKNEVSKVTFTVNFENGHLEYTFEEEV